MMGRLRRAGLVAFVAALLAAAAVVVVRLPAGVETDVLAMLGAGDSPVLALSRRSASSFRVLCRTPEAAACCRAAASFDPPADLPALRELVRTRGKGLLSLRQRAELLAGETNRIVRSARRRDFTGVGLFPRADDPYYLLNDFVLSLRAHQPKLAAGEELLVGRTDGASAASGVALDRLLALARERSDVEVSGAPFHARLATESARRELNVLGLVSLSGVLLVGFWLFRGPRFVLPTLLALAAGFLAGSAAAFLLPGRPHVVTFLFGTTLLGLGVDYCYHALAEGMSRGFARNLQVALATTSLAFVPLLFSRVAVLNQMAVFTLTGLVAIAVFVCVSPFARAQLPVGEAPSVPVAGGRRRRVLAVLVFLAVAAGLFALRFDDDPRRLHRMDPLLARGEAAVARVTGLASARFAVVDLEAWQRENAALKRTLGFEPAGAFLAAEDLPRELTFVRNGRSYLVLPDENGTDVRQMLADLMAALAAEAKALLAVSLAVMLLVLFAAYRRRTLAYAGPILAAVLAAAGVLGWMGEPVGFFSVLCFFVVAGLGVDYVVFARGGGSGRVVLASFLTSLLGFGLLAFTSFAVTRAMGLVLALGLTFAYAFAVLLAGAGASARPPSSDGGAWHLQREQAAGRLRLRLMFGIYRLLGKSVAKVCAFFVVCAAYPFLTTRCPFGKAVLFAWSLVDKLDACTLRRALPRMTVVGARDWMDGGCFLLATHVGCIEVLPALPRPPGRPAPRVHAFQQLTHDALYTELFLRHFDAAQFALHSVEELGVETAVEMQEAVARGEIVLMAGDREPASGGRKGVFRFARLMACPVYAIVCVRTGWNAYEVRAERLGDDLAGGYARFLAQASAEFPSQDFHF